MRVWGGLNTFCVGPGSGPRDLCGACTADFDLYTWAQGTNGSHARMAQPAGHSHWPACGRPA